MGERVGVTCIQLWVTFGPAGESVAGLSSVHANRGNLDRLVRTIAEHHGLDLSSYRQAYIERRLAARLRVLGLSTYRQYAERLSSDAEEYARFIQTLTINVTEFFRDTGMWEALRSEVIPTLLAEKAAHHGHTIRIWSAGCATGEEPYSLAMTFLDLLGDDAEQFTLSITGSDIDPDSLAVADAGYYPPSSLAAMPPDYLERFFVSNAEDGPGMRIRPEVRRLIRFNSFSLFDSSPMKLVDLVMCRNVFIYFNRDEQSRVLDQFWKATARGGFLVLGRTEKLSVEAADRLEQVNGRERIYRKPRLG